ncbi:MAG: pyridoxal-phosphate dependent enzyme family protein [uncultured Sphingosinicella sp.]|uniref:Pyridoxal-phosphate dependent enzyme family protein n=1 Tax=uncultured Sphingosinicella sp. TaxID=478748 RepID=A0A6J4TUW8_9SPHN|nr:threonine/serine dehydratase [uncultured Sphingosinicella sp.]CAA9531669.1 MAG: pyridoxal-phosphate dependent enzyme family protein [uncultured Sphingosinicella sp.]
MRNPSRQGVEAAAARIRGEVTRTPLLPLDLGRQRVWAKAECLQQGGSFKLRGATNRLLLLSEDERARGVVAFSSGNHAQGVALAARRLGITATIVMPADAPAVKREATLAAGARIVDYDRRTESREEIGARLALESGATLVPSFDDVDIIEGQGSVGVELREQVQEAVGALPDTVLVCCGGGGLSAGIALALPESRIVTVEPEGWDDMAWSLAAGVRVPVADDAPPTRCDSLQTRLVSPLTFAVLHGRGARGVSVSDEEVAHAMRVAFARLRLVVEPAGAAALAAVLAGKVEARPGTVIVLSGGNVDPGLYAGIIGDQAAS